MKQKIDLHKLNIALFLLLFLTFVYLAYLFPFSGDDYDWGSYIGIERLKDHFSGYNGRYLGNIIVLVLTRIKFLRIIIVPVIVLLICDRIAKIARLNDYCYFIPFVLIFVMNRAIFIQTVVWTSGFSNYIPPALLVLLIFELFLKIKSSNGAEYTGKILLFFLGFCSTLFIENITIFCMCFAFFALLICVINKKNVVCSIYYFIGTLIGFLLMFSNTAYIRIIKSEDDYRKIFNLNDIFKSININLSLIIKHFIQYNSVVFVVLIVSLVIISVYESKKSNRIPLIALNALNVLLYITIVGIDAFDFDLSELTYLVVNTIVIGLLFVSVALLVIWCVEPVSERNKVLLLLLGVPISMAPLLVVNPIGPRCLFTSYVLLVCLTSILIKYALDLLKIPDKNVRSIHICSAMLMIAIMAFFTCKYLPVHNYMVDRELSLYEQLKKGNTVHFENCPNSEYVWYEELDGINIPKFKAYYNLGDDVTIIQDFDFEQKDLT
ncbi:MAG: DUF6056 family protein [Clostridia bacterium]|nr:DUF6056 family protein [Clostridia bacterium]